LEQQVHTLADESARCEKGLKALRDAKSIDSVPENRVLLARRMSSQQRWQQFRRCDPRISTSGPANAGKRQRATPNLGGATVNAKLLNPDISLIGDFIGTAGHNMGRPQHHQWNVTNLEFGFQAIIDPSRAPTPSSPSARRGSAWMKLTLTFTSLSLRTGE